IPLVLLGRLDAEALGHRVQEAEAVLLLDRVDLAPGVLARLPVGRELSHRALGEVVDGNAVLRARRRGQEEQGGEEEGEAHGALSARAATTSARVDRPPARAGRRCGTP